MFWFLKLRRLFSTAGREALILWYAFGNPATPRAIKAGSLLLLAIEGLGCMLMAAPLAVPLALLGGVVGSNDIGGMGWCCWRCDTKGCRTTTAPIFLQTTDGPCAAETAQL